MFPAQRKHWSLLRTIRLILRSFNLEILKNVPASCRGKRNWLLYYNNKKWCSNVWRLASNWPPNDHHMLVRAAAAMFCGLSTTTSYSRAGDDLIHEPSSIPKGQSYSTQDNQTRARFQIIGIGPDVIGNFLSRVGKFPQHDIRTETTRGNPRTRPCGQTLYDLQ